MSKRNQVQYTKPEDPTFLKLIKQQIGYKEEPSIEAKKQKLEQQQFDDSDVSDKEDEQPQVIVLKSGDLTAEEAEKEKNRIETENNQKRADLSQRVIFKSKSKDNKDSNISSDQQEKQPKKPIENKAKTSKLSFDEDEFEDE